MLEKENKRCDDGIAPKLVDKASRGKAVKRVAVVTTVSDKKQSHICVAGSDALHRAVTRTRHDRPPSTAISHDIMQHIHYIDSLELPEENAIQLLRQKRKHSYTLDPSRLEKTILEFFDNQWGMTQESLLQADLFGEVDDSDEAVIYFDNDIWQDIEMMLEKTKARASELKIPIRDLSEVTGPTNCPSADLLPIIPSGTPMLPEDIISVKSEVLIPNSEEDFSGVDYTVNFHSEQLPHQQETVYTLALAEPSEEHLLECTNAIAFNDNSTSPSLSPNSLENSRRLTSTECKEATELPPQIASTLRRKRTPRIHQKETNAIYLKDGDRLVRAVARLIPTRTPPKSTVNYVPVQKNWLPDSFMSRFPHTEGSVRWIYARLQLESNALHLFSVTDMREYWKSRLPHISDPDILVGHQEDYPQHSIPNNSASVEQTDIPTKSEPEANTLSDSDHTEAASSFDAGVDQTSGTADTDLTPIPVRKRKSSLLINKTTNSLSKISAVNLMTSQHDIQYGNKDEANATRPDRGTNVAGSPSRTVSHSILRVTAPETLSMYKFLRQKTRLRPVVTFSEIAFGQTKATVARTFMQMLLLRTKGFTELCQPTPFGEISISVVSAFEETFA
eukprot:Gregarina_sp_Poly_1__10288@NODE_723_length_6600_cov_64_797949_g543_i0_p1_GENE_NODE_723_length_6600_cov_64_797949_g543_i0NODE_723_length_6600_cov_64_797949_g543_i0_p1_ORF_typecomplete_len618_score76_19Rad21_Rec8/PF04824_16/1_3e10SMC_ScpA/PF02616_14/9e03SMC_ScpA/PF02616_14/0_0023CNDH2_C/PF16858_5/0_082_NODE_723_length_6600_cov_64_797949_g543_i033155168